MYVFAYDMKGTRPVAEQIKIAQTKGEGWFEYIWPHPHTKKLTPKMSYVRKIPNCEGRLAVDVFK